MTTDDALNSSIAHIVLCCVAGRSFSRVSGRSFVHPGMDANFFIHGVLGFLQSQKSSFGDFGPLYNISLAASKYLALPCLMADLYSSDQNMRTGHLLSGVIPFVLHLAGQPISHEIGNLLIACNIVSLCYYSHKYNREWGWYTAGGAILAYFMTPDDQKICYPMALAFMEFCAKRTIFRVRFTTPPPTQT